MTNPKQFSRHCGFPIVLDSGGRRSPRGGGLGTLVGALILALALNSVAQTPSITAAAPAASAPASSLSTGAPPPAETFFRRDAYSDLVLSPNGRYIAASVPVNERRNVVVLDLDRRDASVITGYKDVDVRAIYWANDNRLVYFTGDLQGEAFRSNGGIYAIDRDGKNAIGLGSTGGGSSALAILQRVRGQPDELFMLANERNASAWDVYRVNVNDGRRRLVTLTGPGKVVQWVLDGNDEPRATLSIDRVARRWWFSHRRSGSEEWTTFAQWDEELKDVIIPHAFDPTDPKSMFVLSNVGRDTLAFFRFDVETGKLGEMVVGSDRYDMGSFGLVGNAAEGIGRLLFSSAANPPQKLIGVRFSADTAVSAWFDETVEKTQAGIDKALPGRVNRFNPNQRRSLVFSSSATDPGGWFIYDQDRQSLEDTGVRVRPWIDPARMASVSYVTYTARDGLKIGAYLTLPNGHVKGRPVPLVVIPHGGPWEKDSGAFSGNAQFMASRGHAVLQPNFRGSTGYGAQHLRASYRQWGGAMTDDIIDGVEWAIREGYADRDRLGVFGASYGGFAALSVMVKRPDLFKWGINYVGVTDLAVHQDTQPAQRYSRATLLEVINGDQKTDAAAFAAQSPARHVERIAAPVFHAYGGRDRNVDYANGRAIREAFDKAGKPYEWMFAADEGHGYRQRKHLVEFYRRVDKFINDNTPPAR